MNGSFTNRNGKVLEVENLSVSYRTRSGWIQAVRNVSFDLSHGETLGIVGESGCGKSTVAFAIVNFLGPNGRITSGSIKFEGRELVGLSRRELNRLRGNRISMVYQDPMSALNPALRIGDQLMEVLIYHRKLSRLEAREECVKMLKKVHMPDPEIVMRRYPHQLSGGQQQRVVIAMAMLNNPALLIMDEPTTALDVTVEAAVLDLVEELKEEFGTSIIFITHNLGVVARVSDSICVMYAGEIVERGRVEQIFERPSHPYTRGLLRCVPVLGVTKSSSMLKPIRGRVPPPDRRNPTMCIFADRCGHRENRCIEARPALEEVEPNHQARCFKKDRLIAMPLSRHRSGDRVRKMPVSTCSDKSAPLLDVKDVKVYYTQKVRIGSRHIIRAVDGVSTSVNSGCTLGIVGESGCGKSTLLKAIIGLERIKDGKIVFMGRELNEPVVKRNLEIIKEIQMVFQNPDSTLNPAYPVGKQIERPLKRFKTVPKDKVREEVFRLLRAVKLGPDYYHRYPRQLSGGEKQRVGIARALASRPNLILCDEPVSALDVSVQAAVLNLLMEIQNKFRTTLIFIAHDLSVVRYISDYVAVMYLGQIMETGPTDRIYQPPYHPYTEALLSAVPIPDPSVKQRRIRLEGNVPSALNPPPGCRFHTRCHRRYLLPDGGRICEEKSPEPQEVAKNHTIYCHLPTEMLAQLEPVVERKSS
ncbi:ABC transporter ATP-binding protein [Thermodesulforhabdus norvegica]|uniref:Peptide/nickel transport system ATP-binding protein n=1 Tax=Thermodesulforhabdus norvegica TaxID=39841 RepID=A0A1I4U714_9BACT|nr:ABC transporter ATP-binding protein [Thermodesulforhabdus norvegica]SFM84762.1 peptide/nickel transport system ATP-binding protein [Thermodesulforhabdus norvegica]